MKPDKYYEILRIKYMEAKQLTRTELGRMDEQSMDSTLSKSPKG